MHQFPPGYLRRIGIGAAAAAAVLVIFLAMSFGGRPTAQEEANQTTARLKALWEKVHKR